MERGPWGCWRRRDTEGGRNFGFVGGCEVGGLGEIEAGWGYAWHGDYLGRLRQARNTAGLGVVGISVT